MVNFLVAYFLLQAAGLLSSQHAAFSRMVCASGIASLSALILFAPELSYPAQILYKILTACAVVAAESSSNTTGEMRRYTVRFAVCSSGVPVRRITAMQSPASRMLSAAYQHTAVTKRRSPCSPKATASCGAVWLVLHFSGSTPQTTRTIGIEFELCGAPVRLRATLDTGCHLKDPVTCLPVLLISWPAAKGRLPGGVNAFLGQWFQGLHPSTPPVGASLRVIPCNTAAQHALLPGFAVADISTITETGMQSLGRTAVAFCPQPFQSGEYEALYGSDFL